MQKLFTIITPFSSQLRHKQLKFHVLLTSITTIQKCWSLQLTSEILTAIKFERYILYHNLSSMAGYYFILSWFRNMKTVFQQNWQWLRSRREESRWEILNLHHSLLKLGHPSLEKQYIQSVQLRYRSICALCWSSVRALAQLLLGDLLQLKFAAMSINFWTNSTISPTQLWLDKLSLNDFGCLPYVVSNSPDLAAAFWSTESGSPEINNSNWTLRKAVLTMAKKQNKMAVVRRGG